MKEGLHPVSLSALVSAHYLPTRSYAIEVIVSLFWRRFTLSFPRTYLTAVRETNEMDNENVCDMLEKTMIALHFHWNIHFSLSKTNDHQIGIATRNFREIKSLTMFSIALACALTDRRRYKPFAGASVAMCNCEIMSR